MGLPDAAAMHDRAGLCTDPQPPDQAPPVWLPDEAVYRILQRAWADRAPARAAGEVHAAGEVRHAAGLASVCRHWRKLLCEKPLPLALDITALPLSAGQRTWLLDSKQAGRVEAASFGYGDSETLWEQPHSSVFLARHGRTLLRLSGVPLRCVAGASEQERAGMPALDLSGLLRLTELSIDCCGIRKLLRWGRYEWPDPLWLWPACLPAALQELHLTGLHGGKLGYLAWAPHAGAGLAGRLPRLQTLRATTHGWGDDSYKLKVGNAYLLRGLPSSVRIEVEGEGEVEIHSELFQRASCVRVTAGGCINIRHGWLASLVDFLRPANLQAAELRAEHNSIKLYAGPFGWSHTAVGEMVDREDFAVEVGVPDPAGGGYNYKARLFRLAWCRWPAPGAPGRQAAEAAHEHARAWAASMTPRAYPLLACMCGSHVTLRCAADTRDV